MNTRDLLDLVINGSQQFQTKFASADNSLQPDTATPGHVEFARQVRGIAEMLNKTAEYVEQGIPAKAAWLTVAKEADAEPSFATKAAGLFDELGYSILNDVIRQTYENKVASAHTSKTASAATHSSARLPAALNRMQQLASYLG